MSGFQASEARVPILSLDEELGQLRAIAARLGRSRESEQIQESILGVALYCRQMKEQHEQEVVQLRDEIRILHQMIANAPPLGKAAETGNIWRSHLQRRAGIEAHIRGLLEGNGKCTAVLVPLPSPLVAQSGSHEVERFLKALQPEQLTASMWTSRLAIVLSSERDHSFGKQVLPETFRLNEVSYVVRARAREVVSLPGERGEEYLKRIEEKGSLRRDVAGEVEG